MLLIEAKKIGLEKVLITIHSDNIASQKIALANGGVITEKTEERVYIWIESSSIKSSSIDDNINLDNSEIS